MIKIYMQDKSIRGAKLVQRSMTGEVYRLTDGNFLKLFEPTLRKVLNKDHSLERKIMSARPIVGVPEIIVPKKGVYNMQNQFVGYVVPPAEGVNLNSYQISLTPEQRSSLHEYGKLFYNISDAVERGNKRNIVFPDLCTCDNIFVNDGKISFIDYDGIQVGKHEVYCISTTLGSELQYHNDKYMNGELFTSELDKKSLVLLYFLLTFNIDLNKIGQKNPVTGETITLYSIFDLLGLQDYDLMQKVYNTLSSNKKGESIKEDVVRIAEEYDMNCFVPINGCHYIKKLTKKQ